MKKILPLILTMFLSICLFAQTQEQPQIFHKPITQSAAQQVALMHVSSLSKNMHYTILTHRELIHKSQSLAHVFDLLPIGYVVVSNSSLLPPVMAYSFESHFGEFDSNNPLFNLLCVDLSNRKFYVETEGLSYAEKNLQQWDTYNNEESLKGFYDRFEQWPDGMDGWLQTAWNQYAPYYNMCPMDPVTSVRSVAGCPSVAMALILNFHKTTNNTRLDNGDDYYHNYAGRQYWIDDDFSTLDFPSFPQLNEYLDTLDAHFATNTPLTNQDKAALTFACGVACTQVYTSSGSGTFGVNQAYSAYVRFGFLTISLLDESDTDLYERLQQNIKDTLPAHLAVVDSAWSMGHNVAVDGYNTNDYYHINFGWGGTYDGWYLLPDEIPYNLTVVEGLIVDITPPNYAGIFNDENKHQEISAFPNPASHSVTISFHNPEHKNLTLSVYNSIGQLVYEATNITDNEVYTDVSKLSGGVYFLKLSDGNVILGQGKIVVE